MLCYINKYSIVRIEIVVGNRSETTDLFFDGFGRLRNKSIETKLERYVKKFGKIVITVKESRIYPDIVYVESLHDLRC